MTKHVSGDSTQNQQESGLQARAAVTTVTIPPVTANIFKSRNGQLHEFMHMHKSACKGKEGLLLH